MSYAKKAIERLNLIDWHQTLGTGHEKDMELGIEFMKKLFAFCKKNKIRPRYPTYPFMTDLSSFFADIEIDDEIWNQCNHDIRDRIETPSFSTVILSHYIKAAILADQDPQYAACMDVYDPIIRLFEKGGDFYYRERGMSFQGSGLIPLTTDFVERIMSQV